MPAWLAELFGLIPKIASDIPELLAVFEELEALFTTSASSGTPAAIPLEPSPAAVTAIASLKAATATGPTAAFNHPV